MLKDTSRRHWHIINASGSPTTTDFTLEALSLRVFEALKAEFAWIATAESCTGGLAASCLTDVSGSSQHVAQSWVVYANEAKTAQLGVEADLLAEYGAVSQEVAVALALGANQRSHDPSRTVALSFTGIAGPLGGSEAKPVGCCHQALCIPWRREVWVQKVQLPKGLSRTENKQGFVAAGFQLVLTALLNQT